MTNRFGSLLLLSVSFVAAFADSASNQSLDTSLSNRRLDVGDFAILNEVFKEVEFAIDVPDPIVVSSLFDSMTVQLNNLVCRDIEIGDITLTYGQPDEKSVSFTMNVIQFDIQCSFDYTYDLGISGSASASLFTEDNSLSVDFLLSQTEAGLPPNDLVISNCAPAIVIINIDFSGGLVASLLDTIEGSLRGLIADKISSFLCDYMTDLEELGLGLMSNLTEFVEPYLNTAEVDPLAPEVEFNSTRDPAVPLINFQNPEGFLGRIVATLLGKASQLLGEERDDPDSPTGTGKDLGINILIRDFLLDNDRAFEISPSAFGFLNNGLLLDAVAGNISEMEVRVDRVKLQGLDTFTRFDSFEVIGEYTLQGSFAWQYMMVEVDLYIALGPPGSDQKVVENITVSTKVEDLEFSFAALSAINSETLGALEISNMLEPSAIVPCLFSTAESLNISSLSVTVGSIGNPLIQDFESPGLGRVLTSGIEGMYELFDGVLVAAMPGLFQTTVKNILNEQIAKNMEGAGCVELKSPPKASKFVDFRDLFFEPSEAKSMGGSGTSPFGVITEMLRDLVDDLLIADDPETRRPKINNELIVPLTRFLSGTKGQLKLNGTLFSVGGSAEIGEFAGDFAFEMYDAKIDNLNSIDSPLVLLQPSNRSGSELDNNMIFGFDNRPLRASARVLVSVQGENIDVHDELEVSINLVHARASLFLLLQMLSPRLLSMKLTSLLNVNCWLATIPAPALDARGIRQSGVERTAGLVDALLEIKKLFINVTCHECTSPGFSNLAERLLSDEGSQGTTDLANSLFDKALTLLDGEFLQMFLDRAISEAPFKCPTDPAYIEGFQKAEYESFEEVELPSDSAGLLITVVAITAGIAMCFFIISQLVRCFVQRRNRNWLQTLPDDAVCKVYAEQTREVELATYLRESTDSMFSSKDVPAIVRYSMPIIVLGNIALFVSGHLSVGGAVSIFVQFAEEEIVIENVFTFSIAQSVIELWNSGGKQLAILIMIFSVIWPYTKQLITLTVWFLPPKILSVSRRGSIFHWLDVLAKWSSADIFVLIVSLVAFNITINSPLVSFLPVEFYSVQLMLIPLWGLYANLIAQLVSQVSSHAIIHYHRRIVREALSRRVFEHEEDALACFDGMANEHPCADAPRDESLEQAPPESLYDHGFQRTHRGNGDKLTVRRGVNIMLIGMSLILVALIIVGCVLPTFSFEQLGLLGVAVEIGRSTDVATNAYSVFSIANTLFQQGLSLGTASSITGMLVISSLIVLTVFVVPMIQVVVLLYQWFRPLKQMQRGKLEVFVEILYAWQYVEVFVIAVMVAAWQLGPTSEFLVNEYCENLTETFSALVYYGILKTEDAQCFKLNATIEVGSYILIAAAFLLTFLNTFVPKAVFQYQRDKLTEERRLAEPSGLDPLAQNIADTMEIEKVRERIQPTPVLFSDTFRWLLDSAPAPPDEDVAEVKEESIVANRSSKGFAKGERTFLPELLYTADSTFGSREPSVYESDSELASYGIGEHASEYDEVTL